MQGKHLATEMLKTTVSVMQHYYKVCTAGRWVRRLKLQVEQSNMKYCWTNWSVIQVMVVRH